MKNLDPDPFYLFLHLILRRFLKSGLEVRETLFVLNNINKHRKVLWINLICATLVFLALRETRVEDMGVLITCLIAPVMLTGTAWFAISFGGVPAKLIEVAMSITFWMFTAFMISLTTMFLTVCYILPFFIWPVLFLIYLGVIVSCILYDTCDGLKAGLDDALLTHSKTAIRYYRKMGIDPE